MRALPDEVTSYKKTPLFSESSVPAGLTREHRTKRGVWGKIVVTEGRLRYVIHEPHEMTVELSPNTAGIIEPTMLHHVEPIDAVRFYVEFYR